MPKSAAEQKLLDKATKSTIKNLKKIIAGGGKLEGVFYFTGNKQGDDAALVVNLMAKDRKGATAESLGKKLRKAIPQAKFKRGTIKIDESKKLVFSLVKGNASASEMRKTFKDNFAKQAGMAFIKKAVFSGKDVSGDDATDSDLSEADLTINALTDLGLTQEEMDSIVSLMEGDPDLLAFFDDETRVQALEEQNQEMNDSFLKANEEEEEWDAFIQQEKDKIAALQTAADSGDPDALKALQEAQEEFASSQTNGADLPTDIGSPIDARIQVLLDSSNKMQGQQIHDRHDSIGTEIMSLLDAMKSQPEAEQYAFVLENNDKILELMSQLEQQVLIYRNLITE